MTEINLLDIKHGDTVTARFKDEYGEYEIIGKVQADDWGDSREVGGKRLIYATKILEHIPAKPDWHDALVVRRKGLNSLWGQNDNGWHPLGYGDVVRSTEFLEGLGEYEIVVDKDGKVRST